MTDNHEYYFRERCSNATPDMFKCNTDRVLTIMKDIFLYKNVESLGDNDLVIHIRSGDIFSPYWAGPHPDYIMPPLSYYTNIINNNNYENIYLIAEDNLNPCINKLLELYPNIQFTIQSLEKDINTILSAVNIVISYGTFIPQLMFVSDNIKNMYSPSYTEHDNNGFVEVPNYNIIITDLNQYRYEMYPWRNIPEQYNKMLTYK